jgi:hypothetical protein
MKSLVYVATSLWLCLLVEACRTETTSVALPDAKAPDVADADRAEADAPGTDGRMDLRSAGEASRSELGAQDAGSKDANFDAGADAATPDGVTSVRDTMPDSDASATDLLDVGAGDLPAAGCPGGFAGGEIWSDLTLTKACSPYVIRSSVVIVKGTLTIEAGAVLLFEPAASLFVEGGRLDVRGTQAENVVFDLYGANPSRSPWHGLEFIRGAASPSQVRYATIRNCGSPAASSGCVFVSNVSKATLVALDHVTIAVAAGNGLLTLGISDFSLTNCTFRNIAKDAFAVWVYAPQFVDIGPGNDFGGAPIAIYGSIPIDTDTVWTSPGTDIVVISGIDVVAQKTIDLSLGAGMKFLFQLGAGIMLDGYSHLTVRGTADAPVVFSSARATPKPGDWAGIYVGVSDGDGLSGLNISHALIEFAGGGSWATGTGGILLDGWPVEAVITDSTIRQNAGEGIHLACSASALPVLTGTTFAGNASDTNQTGAIADNVGPGPSGSRGCAAP